MSSIRFIAGSGRSGTTWIQDAIAEANGLRPVFEPLHPWISSVGERYAHRALGPNDSHPGLAEFLLKVGAGRGPRLWTQYRQQTRWLFPPPARFSTRQDMVRVARHWLKFLSEIPRMTRDGFRRDALVKCIRANLMLPWIARHLECRVILVMRHPGAVVESELRGGWTAAYAIERYRADPTLHRLTGGRYREMLSRQLGPVESLALRWVIENQWVAESAQLSGVPVFHYESLRSSERSEWARLCSALGVARVPEVSSLMRPSQQSGAGRTMIPIELSESPRWMRALTDLQKEQVSSVIEAVGLDTYSMSEALPRSGFTADPRLTDARVTP
jgi:hypothetical protein